MNYVVAALAKRPSDYGGRTAVILARDEGETRLSVQLSVGQRVSTHFLIQN